MSNEVLLKAQKAKLDEFYTYLEDFEKELKYYQEAFKDKIVLCNCNDVDYGSFFQYFESNFNKLGLKKLIATNYETIGSSYKVEIYRKLNGDIDKRRIGLKENGDFRTPECIEVLKEADIVCTNPPFSLFREYVSLLVKNDKKFIILGNVNAITYKEIFPLIKENKVWLGVSIHSGDREFEIPKKYISMLKKCRTDEEGRAFTRIKGVRWFTNLDHKKQHEELILYKYYTPEEYQKYDNYDAINVDKVAEIPCDYDGIMGVPITFIDKYNTEQFEILGITDRQNTSGLRIKKYTAQDDKRFNDLNARGTIKTCSMYKSTYARILIRRRFL